MICGKDNHHDGQRVIAVGAVVERCLRLGFWRSTSQKIVRQIEVLAKFASDEHRVIVQPTSACHVVALLKIKYFGHVRPKGIL